MGEAPVTSDRDALEAVDAGYRSSGRTSRWDGHHPGNRAALDERTAVLRAMVERSGAWDGTRILDVGCGPGLAGRGFAEALDAEAVVGVDLIRASVEAAARALGPRVALADGMALPFATASVPLVLCFTTFAMASPEPRRRMAADIARVLRPGGAVVVYDLRLPSPGNRGVRPLRRRELRALFPGFAGEVRSVSLLPPVARRLGPATPWAYPLLARLPFLRSHLAAVLVKPSA